MAELQLPVNTSIQIKHAEIVKGPTQIAFDITNKCNFRCLHCFNRSSENDRMNDELTDKQVKYFIKDIIKMKPFNICLCGGEPLIRFHLICDISSMLKENDIMVSMVTNGYLLTEEKAEKLFASGVRRVQVSLDGACPETHERLRVKKGSFNKAIEAIKIFKTAGFDDVGVAFTPTNFNCHEASDVIALCRNLGVRDFRVQPLMCIGRAKTNMGNILPSNYQYRNLVKTLNESKTEYTDIKIEWGDPIDHLIRFRTVTQHLNVFLVVQANGDIAASPYLPITIGNIKKHSILKYWKKGLPKVWQFEPIKKIANNIKCMSDFSKEHKDLPIVWFDQNIRYDVIDDKLISS
ncbi:MAG: radical SAM protein [Spirochaetales bacterium]|nr:radical SAM protein [Spirochaetales bacterium]